MSDRTQPWREWLDAELREKTMPSDATGETPKEDSQKPWLTWQPTPEDPSVKPWLTWNPNIDNGEVDPTKKIIKTQVMGACSSLGKQTG